jgi:hypothetical protein
MGDMTMVRFATAFFATLLLAACAMSSNWYLMDAGYSINPVNGDPDGYAIEVHLNQMKQIGGDVNSAEFRRFVSERLKWHGVCPTGWQPDACVKDGSCIQRTSRSLTVTGRCLAL